MCCQSWLQASSTPLSLCISTDTTNSGLLCRSRYSYRWLLHYETIILYAKLLERNFPMGVPLTWRPYFGSRTYLNHVKFWLQCTWARYHTFLSQNSLIFPYLLISKMIQLELESKCRKQEDLPASKACPEGNFRDLVMNLLPPY
jgi:hypothetical protein